MYLCWMSVLQVAGCWPMHRRSCMPQAVLAFPRRFPFAPRPSQADCTKHVGRLPDFLSFMTQQGAARCAWRSRGRRRCAWRPARRPTTTPLTVLQARPSRRRRCTQVRVDLCPNPARDRSGRLQRNCCGLQPSGRKCRLNHNTLFGSCSVGASTLFCVNTIVQQAL